MRLGPGTLYGSIKRLLVDRLIEESDERPDLGLDDQRRRYYRLTGFGRRVAGAGRLGWLWVRTLWDLISTAIVGRRDDHMNRDVVMGDRKLAGWVSCSFRRLCTSYPRRP